MSVEEGQVVLRRPVLADGLLVWELVRLSGTLDLNSCYLYLLLCDQFADTCVIAQQGDQIQGFVTAYIRPDKSDTLFVWQVGVLPSARGKGLAKAMLRHLWGRDVCRSLKWLEATVSPSNQPSRNLFAAMASELGTEINEHTYIGIVHFPINGSHEPEPLLRLGPFQAIH